MYIEALPILLTLLGMIGLGMSSIGLPGIFLVFLAFAVQGFLSGFHDVSINTLIIIGVITFLSFWLDNVFSLIGVKLVGASKKAVIGCIVGSIIGFFTMGPFGVIIGSLLGAVAVEFLLHPNDFQKSLKAGLGAFIGFLTGMFLKFIITLALFIWLLFAVW